MEILYCPLFKTWNTPKFLHVLWDLFCSRNLYIIFMWTKLHSLLFLTIFTERIYVCFCFILFYLVIEVYKVYKATTLGNAFIFSLRFAIKSSVTKYMSSHFYRVISAALEGYQTNFEFINSASKVNKLSKTHNILDRSLIFRLQMWK